MPLLISEGNYENVTKCYNLHRTTFQFDFSGLLSGPSLRSIPEGVGLHHTCSYISCLWPSQCRAMQPLTGTLDGGRLFYKWLYPRNTSDTCDSTTLKPSIASDIFIEMIFIHGQLLLLQERIFIYCHILDIFFNFRMTFARRKLATHSHYIHFQDIFLTDSE